MAAAIFASCLVVFSSLSACEGARTQVNGTVDGTVYLIPMTQVTGYNQISWRFNETREILTVEGNHKVSYRNAYFNENKLHYHKNHTLEIRQLQKRDTGTYKMVVEDSQSRITNEYFQLDVYEKNSAVPLSPARKLADSILAFGFLLLIHNLV